MTFFAPAAYNLTSLSRRLHTLNMREYYHGRITVTDWKLSVPDMYLLNKEKNPFMAARRQVDLVEHCSSRPGRI
jgi:hypothetical protein